ncbi:tRNA dihydrouridine(20/20a) synthase DusA [Ponticaulis profundi]|uniref:tRNA-dihydrouridine(20/20a) synthase n=1 Tax=Ponticaulis profundi TaxID=2665222 RepID=A0ABW1S6H6_9PROT
MTPIDYRFSVAPMMDWTDRHCRAFHRELSAHALLFTEMVTADAVIHGERERLIGFSDVEHPLAIQLGGNEPSKLAEASRIAEDFGYDEVNLNCGCPSDRVQSGAFGACLMRDPELVAECLSAMQAAVSIPVTVKHRIGVDDDEPRDRLFGFVETVSRNSPCTVFTVHARKAWLKGLSPKENRDIPPLDYPLVHELKAAYPQLTILLNGGLATMEDCLPHMPVLDGVMLGRAPYQNPSILLDVDETLFGGVRRHPDMVSALSAYRPYLVRQLEQGTPLHAMTRHILGAFNGLPGARQWRRHLSENAPRQGADISVFDEALSKVTRLSVSAA